jgi:hypothetical protein
MIGVGKKHNGLYYLLLSGSVSTDSNPRVLSTSVKVPSSFVNNWHYRLGHPSPSRITLLHHLVPSIPCDSNNVCTVCPLAK